MITTLSQLIAAAESGNNQYAVRFEPAYHPDPKAVSKLAGIMECTANTAEILCSCSWGLYQIMGDNLVNLGLQISPIHYCAIPAMQDQYFSKFLARDNLSSFTLADILHYPEKRLQFAKLYNGPGLPERYADYLMQVYQKFKG